MTTPKSPRPAAPAVPLNPKTIQRNAFGGRGPLTPKPMPTDPASQEQRYSPRKAGK
jgi:hypothetical protein